MQHATFGFVRHALVQAVGFTVALGATAGAAHAADTTSGKYNSVYAGLGIKGYDAVAYFTEGKPVQGSKDFSYDWKGVTWLFASAEHRDLFKAQPEKYAPQYGAYCSWGVAQGKLFDVDPVHAWKIVDGKLYMNFNSDIEATWEKDIPGFITKAEKNWPALNR
jgi:YHS domain-containing protein